MKHHMNGRPAVHNPRSKFAGQNAEMPAFGNGDQRLEESAAYTRAQEAPNSPMGGGAPELTAELLSTAPRRKNPLWMNVISVFLCVTLSLMAWNETSIAEARTAILGDTPVANSADDADSSASDPSEADGNTDAEDGEGDDGSQSEAPNFEELGLQAISALGDAQLAEFMPEGLVAADEVLPTVTDQAQERKSDTVDNAASMDEEELQKLFDQRVKFSLAATGALQDSDGNYQVNGQEITLTPQLWQLGSPAGRRIFGRL